MLETSFQFIPLFSNAVTSSVIQAATLLEKDKESLSGDHEMMSLSPLLRSDHPALCSIIVQAMALGMRENDR